MDQRSTRDEIVASRICRWTCAVVPTAQLLTFPVVWVLAYLSLGIGGLFLELSPVLGVPILLMGAAAILGLEYGVALLAVLSVRYYLPWVEQASSSARRVAAFAVMGCVAGWAGEVALDRWELAIRAWGVPDIVAVAVRGFVLIGGPTAGTWLAARPRRVGERRGGCAPG